MLVFVRHGGYSTFYGYDHKPRCTVKMYAKVPNVYRHIYEIRETTEILPWQTSTPEILPWQTSICLVLEIHSPDIYVCDLATKDIVRILVQ